MFVPEVPQITWPPTSDARPPMKRLQHGRGQWLRSDQHKSHWSPESSTISNRRLIPWCHVVTVIVSQVLLRIGEATKGPTKTWNSGSGNRKKKDGTCRCWCRKDPSSDMIAIRTLSVVPVVHGVDIDTQVGVQAREQLPRGAKKPSCSSEFHVSPFQPCSAAPFHLVFDLF